VQETPVLYILYLSCFKISVDTICPLLGEWLSVGRVFTVKKSECSKQVGLLLLHGLAWDNEIRLGSYVRWFFKDLGNDKQEQSGTLVFL
jgi:hypothetical protein